MPVTITQQPAANSINAAYRPVAVSVTADLAAPVVYCDIYFNSIFYKTISKTQAPFNFDIQNAAQEYLKKSLPANGGKDIVSALSTITACFTKIRGSATDVNDFLVPDAPVPVQGTGTTAAISGGGTQSNTFFVLNATLQHEDNQDLATHLNAFKSGAWDANAFPLTHRQGGYIVGKNSSDYFPIISNNITTCIKLHYKSKASGQYAVVNSCGGSSGGCVAVSIPGNPNLPNAVAGAAYYYGFTLSGDLPFTISSAIIPAWLIAQINEETVSLSGTPSGADIANGINVNLTILNACGSVTFSDTLNVNAACVPAGISGTPSLPNGQVNQAYSYSIQLTGTAPFTLSNIVKPSWMNTVINGSTITLTGTPIAQGSAINVSFSVSNDCGIVPVSDTIDVAPVPAAGAGFSATTFVGGDALNDNEVANITGEPNAVVTVSVTTYENTNGGQLKANGSQVFLNSTLNVTLDTSGNGSFTCDIAGVTNSNPGNIIRGVFTITSVSGGTIGTSNTYQTSKVF